MALNYVNLPTLSKFKVGTDVYYLKDAEARAHLDAELAKLGSAAYRTASDVVVEGSDNLVSAKAVATYLETTMADVAKALVFQGVADEGSDFENNNVLVGGEKLNAGKGDVVISGTKEYVFDGSKWIELGDEGLYLSQAEAAAKYVAKTFTIAGIDMADSITADELKTALGLGALAYKDSASGSITVVTAVNDATYTPAGSVEVTLGHTSTAMTSAGTYTPVGNVTGNVTAAGSVSIAKNDNGTQISGSVSAPTITVTPATTQVQHIDSLGTLPSYTAAQYVAPSVAEAKSQFASEGMVAAIDETDSEMLVISAAAKSDALTATGFNAGSYTAAEFNAGALPTLGAAQTVVTGIASAEASAPVFTGDKFGASFAGSEVAINASFAGVEGNLSVSGNYDKANVQSTGFTGTEATISHGVSTAAKTVTVQ